MKEAFIIDGIRTPIGNFGGSLSTTRTDDLAAIAIKGLMHRNPGVNWKISYSVVLIKQVKTIEM